MSMTMPDLIAAMTRASRNMVMHTEHALEHAARVVETEAKAEIGHDEMAAAGQFAAWPALKAATQREKTRLGYVGQVSEYDSLLRTGELRESISHQVHVAGPTSGEAVVGSNEAVAVYQELGTRTIPARSFLGASLVRKTPEVVGILGSAIHRALIEPGGLVPIK